MHICTLIKFESFFTTLNELINKPSPIFFIESFKPIIYCMKFSYLVPAASVVALLFAYYFFKKMMCESEGSETMQKIARYVREGTMSYLKQQYKVVAVVFVVLACLPAWFFSGYKTIGFRLLFSPEVFSRGLPVFSE